MKNLVRIVLIAALVGLSFTPSSAMGQFFFMEDENVGKPAKDFTLDTLTGNQVNFTEFRNGQKAIIFFWATWCPHCRRQLKTLSLPKTQQALAEKNIVLVLVDQGESAPVVAKYFEKHNFDFPVFLDKESKLADPYGLIGLPTFVFVNEEGFIREVTHSLPEDYEKVFAKQ